MIARYTFILIKADIEAAALKHPSLASFGSGEVFDFSPAVAQGYPVCWLDQPFRNNTLNHTKQWNFSFLFLDMPPEGATLDELDELISKMDTIADETMSRLILQAPWKGKLKMSTGWNNLSVRDYGDDMAVGVRTEVTITAVNPTNKCDIPTRP